LKNIKLYILLQSFTTDELKLLRKAVNSPYFNSNPSVISLFEKLKKQHPKYDKSPRGRRILYKKIFPQEAFNDGKLRRLFTFLTRIIEKYLVAQQVMQKEEKYHQTLSEVYKERNLITLFEQESKRLEEQYETKATQTPSSYLDKHLLLSSRYSSFSHNKYDKKDKTLSESAKHLDTYYLLQKLKTAVLQKNREKIFGGKLSIGFLSLPDIDTLPENTLLRLYYQAYYLLTEEKEIDINQYEMNLFRQLHLLSQEDTLLLFYNGLNFLIRKTKNKLKQDSRILNWYKKGLNEGYFTLNNNISTTTFSNIVTYSCVAKAFTWAANFIEQYAEYLPDNVKEDEVRYSLLVLDFEQKKYKNIVFGLSNYELSAAYYIKTKNLQIRTYFELLKEDDNYLFLLEDILKSTQNYFYRNEKFGKEHAEFFTNFLHICQIIVRMMQDNHSREAIKKRVQNFLQEQSKILSRAWIEEKFGS